eukprot:1247698-Rhodomonas_salina.1
MSSERSKRLIDAAKRFEVIISVRLLPGRGLTPPRCCQSAFNEGNIESLKNCLNEQVNPASRCQRGVRGRKGGSCQVPVTVGSVGYAPLSASRCKIRSQALSRRTAVTGKQWLGLDGEPTVMVSSTICVRARYAVSGTHMK